MKKALISFVVILTTLNFSHAADSASQKPASYFDPATLDPKSVLPAPRLNNSDAAEKEVEIILQKQADRTPQQLARINQDSHYNVFAFGNVVGGWLSKGTVDHLPATTGLLSRVMETAKPVAATAAGDWNRPRPFMVNSRVYPPIERPVDSGYPSTHATRATVDALVLAQLAPDQAKAIFTRAQQIGDDRVAAGVQFPSDVAAGQKLAQAIYDRLAADPQFQQDLKAAKAEVLAARKRQFLNLPDRLWFRGKLEHVQGVLFFVRITALWWVLGLMFARADDITLTDGTVFKNAHVVSHDEKSASITFSGGAAMVKIEMVPPGLVQDSILPNFPGSAQPAPAPAKKDVAVPPAKISQQTKEATNAGALQASGSVVSVTKDGLLVSLGVMEAGQRKVPHREQTVHNLVPEGLGHTPVNETVVKTWTTTESSVARRELGVVFVATPFDGNDVLEGSMWDGNVWHVGRYAYTDADQVPHSLEQYTTNRDEAYQYFTAHPRELPRPAVTPDAGTIISQTPVQTTSSVATPPMNP